ncbi:MAG: hypothetical protein IPL39_17855 [Opitutaceae bacterium]|nr:hypothetical protein [Opitutaceae bacterium]
MLHRVEVAAQFAGVVGETGIGGGELLRHGGLACLQLFAVGLEGFDLQAELGDLFGEGLALLLYRVVVAAQLPGVVGGQAGLRSGPLGLQGCDLLLQLGDLRGKGVALLLYRSEIAA